MRKSSHVLGAIVLMGAAVTPAFALSPNTGNTLDIDAVSAEKWATDRGGGVPNPIYVNVGGDTIGSATVIPGIPYSDTGSTCEFTHDYDEVCPYNLPGAPDVVYSFAPTADMNIMLSLCTSMYDTKFYVYENEVGNLVGCNDDVCGSDSFKSELEAVSLTAGNTYYIVVDGWSPADCGDYELVVGEGPDCMVNCLPGSTLEGEPDCENDTLDLYNGGCNSNPPTFSAIPCHPPQGDPVTMCGSYGGFTYFGLSYRDTDWYVVEFPFPLNVTWCVTGEYDTLIGVIDGTSGCPASFYDYALADACEQACLNVNVTAGGWWFFVATSGFGPSAGACGGDYVATLEDAICVITNVESASWGAIKNLYK